MILILMGVSGSGKTTIGRLIAERLGWIFADADDFHPPAYKQKMAEGHALTDEDRAPWLDVLNKLLRKWEQDGTNGVLACSALKGKYRDTLRDGLDMGKIRTVFLDVPRELLAERLKHRKHEFMNPLLMESQLTTLEPPGRAFRILNDKAPNEIVNSVVEYITPVQ
jgi:gluconokinase